MNSLTTRLAPPRLFSRRWVFGTPEAANVEIMTTHLYPWAPISAWSLWLPRYPGLQWTSVGVLPILISLR